MVLQPNACCCGHGPSDWMFYSINRAYTGSIVKTLGLGVGGHRNEQKQQAESSIIVLLRLSLGSKIQAFTDASLPRCSQLLCLPKFARTIMIHGSCDSLFAPAADFVQDKLEYMRGLIQAHIKKPMTRDQVTARFSCCCRRVLSSRFRTITPGTAD